MIFRYGGYAHPPGEVALAIEKRAVFSARGVRERTRETWRLQGVLQADSQAGLTAALEGLRQAYGTNGLDAGLYLDDGVTPTSHVLRSSETLGGVRVVGLDFPESRGAEYSTYRSYALTLEAEFEGAETNLLALDETLTFRGGGARFVYLQTLGGMPQRQQVATSTPYTVVQAGSAVGAVAYPVPPGPLWPAAEHQDRRRTVLRSPQLLGASATRYVVEWHYEFEAAAALVGRPQGS